MKLLNIQDNNIVISFLTLEKEKDNNIIDIQKKLFVDEDNYLVLKIYFMYKSNDYIESIKNEKVIVKHSDEIIFEDSLENFIQQKLLFRKNDEKGLQQMSEMKVNIFYAKFKYTGSSILYISPNNGNMLNIIYTCEISFEHKIYLLDTCKSCKFYFIGETNEKREILKNMMDEKFVDAYDMFVDGNYYFSLCAAYLFGGIVMNSPFVPLMSFDDMIDYEGEKFEQIISYEKWSPICLEKIISIANTIKDNIFFNYENLNYYKLLKMELYESDKYVLEKSSDINLLKKSNQIILFSPTKNEMSKNVYKKSQMIDDTFQIFIENDKDNYLPEYEFYLRKSKNGNTHLYIYRKDLYKSWEYDLKCKLLNINTHDYINVYVGESKFPEKIIELN